MHITTVTGAQSYTFSSFKGFISQNSYWINWHKIGHCTIKSPLVSELKTISILLKQLILKLICHNYSLWNKTIYCVIVWLNPTSTEVDQYMVFYHCLGRQTQKMKLKKINNKNGSENNKMRYNLCLSSDSNIRKEWMKIQTMSVRTLSFERFYIFAYKAHEPGLELGMSMVMVLTTRSYHHQPHNANLDAGFSERFNKKKKKNMV